MGQSKGLEVWLEVTGGAWEALGDLSPVRSETQWAEGSDWASSWLVELGSMGTSRTRVSS